MKKIENKPMSMFSAETLDSIAMAELNGGDSNSFCSNPNCINNCLNSTCINTTIWCNVLEPNMKCI